MDFIKLYCEYNYNFGGCYYNYKIEYLLIIIN